MFGQFAGDAGSFGTPVSSADHGTDQRASKNYRADIDGLRALAVLPIVAFHLRYHWMGGGYVGVDIFFVISGYLIGGSILQQIRAGRYSVSDFYFRRFRRIAPALVATLAAVTIAAWFILLPKAFVAYGKSLIATALFASNFWFWGTSDYFASKAETLPLLHTWSLAVEEQFYILFPLLMLGMRQMPARAVLGVIVLISLASLVASALLLHPDPTGTFYLLPTRIWELLLGVIAAGVQWQGLRAARWGQEIFSVIGVALIAGALFLYRPETPFPGLAAIPPCLGTAMLLVVGAHGRPIVSRLLSLQPLTFFGLISYSLYLWHWPVIVLMGEGLPMPWLTRWYRIGAFLLSVALAWLQWRLIERPWRSPSIRPRTIFTASAVSFALLCVVGGMVVASQGVTSRFKPEATRMAAVLDDHGTNDLREGRCFISSAYDFTDFNMAVCLRHDPAHTNVLLLGDSHAAHLWSGLTDRYPRLNVMQATASGCKALTDRGVDALPRCERLMRYIFDAYLPRHPGEWVILAGNWYAADEWKVGATLDWLRVHGFKVVLAGPIVRYQVSLPFVAALAEQRDDPKLLADFREGGQARLDADYARLAASHGALYFSPYGALCGTGTCRIVDDQGVPVQFDYGHLTRQGSRIVAGLFPIAAVTGGAKP
jgi:peptidoglycan/LPS O-acetylase OafA/YrhL